MVKQKIVSLKYTYKEYKYNCYYKTEQTRSVKWYLLPLCDLK